MFYSSTVINESWTKGLKNVNRVIHHQPHKVEIWDFFPLKKKEKKNQLVFSDHTVITELKQLVI